MKKTGLLFLITLFSSTWVSAQSSGYKIAAKIKGMTEDKTIYLAHYYGQNQYIKIDSCKVKNGAVEFKGDKDLERGLYLVVLDPSRYYDVVISGTERNMAIEADTADYVNTVKFTGSPENQKMIDYRKFLAKKSEQAQDLSKQMQAAKDDKGKTAAITAQYKVLQEEVKMHMQKSSTEQANFLSTKFINANIEPEVPEEDPILPNGKRDSLYRFRLYKSKFFNGVDFSDVGFVKSPFLQTKLDSYFKNLVYQVKDSIITDADKVLKLSKKNQDVYRYVLWFISNKYENTDVIGLEGVFIHLAENYYLKDATWLDSTQKSKFQERVSILKPVETGKTMPNFILQDTTGRDRTLFDTKSKYTLVYFYSPDCGHCKDHAPELVEYHKSHKDKMSVYHVAIDHNEKKKVTDFVKTYKTGDMINLWDAKNTTDFKIKYDCYSTPTTYLLDQNKKIIAKRLAIKEIDGFIEFHEKKMQTESKGK
jgi:thiol-disulfide isomerase/thioredoxin